MAFDQSIQKEIYTYCNNHLPDNTFYEGTFDFIQDPNLKQRIIDEYKGIRFAYKLYEGIEATDENLLFEVRHQILSYASIYEAVIHYVLFTYYQDTDAFHDIQYINTLVKIDIPTNKQSELEKVLSHDGKDIIPCYKKDKKQDDRQIRFESKCAACKKLGILYDIDKDGCAIDLAQEIAEIYSYRNAIHIIAEQRRGISYELELSKKAYWRMQPFIEQVKEKLKADGKGIYATTDV